MKLKLTRNAIHYNFAKLFLCSYANPVEEQNLNYEYSLSVAIGDRDSPRFLINTLLVSFLSKLFDNKVNFILLRNNLRYSVEGTPLLNEWKKYLIVWKNWIMSCMYGFLNFPHAAIFNLFIM